MTDDRPIPRPRALGDRGFNLIITYEGYAKALLDGRVTAYPDPGSKDGEPWTIGFGSTGPDIHKGTIWTRAQAEARFRSDLARLAAAVDGFIGDTPTTQAQFDALVSFHYNTGAIAHSTLGRLHRAGDYAGAAREFRKWIWNDGHKENGLIHRRDAERRLYQS
jgi:GH24 family phage-related lysozyme (muramidase)